VGRRPLIDVDLGIGRCYGYDDPLRVYRSDTVIPPSNGLMAICHPERIHEAHGMCQSCYAGWRRWMNHLIPNVPARLRALGITERNPHERLS
jgi:hypothetical protein